MSDQNNNLTMLSAGERIDLLLGKRGTERMALFSPNELGYVCPACGTDQIIWSEYNSTLWCPNCQLDIPSALCLKDIHRAIDVLLDTVSDAILRERLRPHELDISMLRRARKIFSEPRKGDE